MNKHYTITNSTKEPDINSINLDFLSVFGRDYMFLYYHNLENDDKFLKILANDTLGVNPEDEFSSDILGDLFKKIKKNIHKEDFDLVKDAFSSEKYLELLGNKSKLNINFRWKYKDFGYLYNQMILAKVGEDTSNPKAIIVGLKEVGKEARERIVRETINKKYAATIYDLSQEYQAVFIVDIEKNEMSPCYPAVTANGVVGENGGTFDYDEAVTSYVRDTVIDDQQEHMLLVLSREYIKWSLRKSEVYSREYLNKDNQYCEIKFVLPEQNDDIKIAIMGFGVKDEEIRSKIEDARERDFQQSLMDGLSREYHTVFLIHQDRTMELYRTTGRSTIMEALKIAMEIKDYSICLPLYVRRYIAAGDQDRVLQDATFYSLIRNIPEDGVMPITYKRVDGDGKETYHQACFTKAIGTDDETNIVMGFRDVDATIRDQIREREKFLNVVKERDSDGLTSMNNRFCYERKLKEYPSKDNESISCIYIDADGLHELNNTKGHEAGDIMLKFVASTVQKMWGETDSYRIGGDEFVAFVFDKEEEVLLQEMKELKDIISKEGYRVSTGECTDKLEGLDMTSFIKTAEERMYAEKRAHYSGENDRRRRPR